MNVRGLSPVLCLLAAGCGATHGDVSGVVTFNNKRLDHGNVRVMPTTGLSVDSFIGPDGKYIVKNVPVGPGKVIVTCMDPAMGEIFKAIRAAPLDPGQKGRISPGTPSKTPSKTPAPTGSFSLIPEIYGDFENSGLTVDVTGGITSYDIVLTGEAPKQFKLK